MAVADLQPTAIKKGGRRFSRPAPANQSFMVTFAKKQIIWQTNALPRHTRQALNFLAKKSWLKNSPWYLAGGSALALQVGHRSSVDLDFFSAKKFNNNLLLKNLTGKSWITDYNSEGTIYGTLLGAKVSFIYYPFFRPANKFLRYSSIKVMPAQDIAVMKIMAISQRGRQRDFFDLYWCAKNLGPLKEFIIRLKTQYPSVAHNYHHLLKSLVYFADADNDPLPKINFSASWPQVKKFFTNEVPKIAKEIIKLNDG